MSSNHSDPFAQNLVGLWDFNTGSETDDTGLADGTAQDGHVHGNASFSNGRLHLDGDGDYFDAIGSDESFDLQTGTVAVQFTQDSHVGTSNDTIVNRGEFQDIQTDGWFGIQVTAAGAVEVVHSSTSASGTNAYESLTTSDGFFAAGDTVKAVYSWDAMTGASLHVTNLTTGTEQILTSDQLGLHFAVTDNDGEEFTFGAREANDGSYDETFDGSIDYVALYNVDVNSASAAGDGVLTGSDQADLIDADYVDGDGDVVDGGDAVLPGAGAEDDVIYAYGGDDTVAAGQGDDAVYGGDGADDLSGGDGDDVIHGGDGADTIDGGAGADTLVGGNAGDEIDGGSGADRIEGGAGDDTLQGGSGADVIDGGSGNDTIEAGTEADEVYGGSGDDQISGGAGDDTIYGDSSAPGSRGGEVVRESFEWDADPTRGVSYGFTQNTGNVNVTFSPLQSTGQSQNSVGREAQYLDGVETDDSVADGSSSLDSILYGEGNESDFQLDFDHAVSSVSFRVNDIDGDGIVRVTAYDVDGNQVLVELDAGSSVSLHDSDGILGVDTADSAGGYEDHTHPDYSLLVSIPGPLSRIVIEHDQDGENNSGIKITDIFFDVESHDTGEAGDDTLSGGDGDDEIYGEGGDDTLTGGAGADTISGGAGRDVIFGGAGDTIDGGSQGDDYDILDLTGQGQFYLENVETDSNGNGLNGTVVFIDSLGQPTGETLTFSEIESVRGDQVNRAPEAVDDTVTEPVLAGTPVSLDALVNDTDPDGDALTIVSAKVPDTQGSVEIVDGRVVYTPDPDFQGIAEITYTIEDEDGLRDTATITVPVSNGIVEGTDGADLIDADYTGDPGFDQIDNSDALLPGEAPEDDIIAAGGGDDVVVAGAGDDTIDGGSGNDTLEAGLGSDHVDGGAGDDLIIGGGDNDVLRGGDGRDTFVIDDLDEAETLNTTVDGGSGGDDYDTLDLTTLLADGWTISNFVSNPENNGNPGFDGQITLERNGESANINFTDIERIICFTPGTAIATPYGLRPVEDLRPGDPVLTRDNGVQALAWTGQRRLTRAELAKHAEWQPVLIQSGALGSDLPVRDMVVSPNHRMLLTSGLAEVMFGVREVLVAAKHLTGLDGVSQVQSRAVCYVHVMCERHEILLANGSWTESFQPGAGSLSGIDAAQRDEIFALFPELKTHSGCVAYGAARRSLKKHEARLLTH